MSSLRGDVKALLSIYNAAYLRIHRETMLDEAIAFARNQLKSTLSDLKPPLSMAVSLALETSLCRRMRRLLPRKYISIYLEDATRNDHIYFLNEAITLSCIFIK